VFFGNASAARRFSAGPFVISSEAMRPSGYAGDGETSW
jgi:hypothetical protein